MPRCCRPAIFLENMAAWCVPAATGDIASDQNVLDGGSERSCILRSHEGSPGAVTDDLWKSTRCRCHDRDTQRHRLQRREAESLIQRRHEQYFRFRKKVAQA